MTISYAAKKAVQKLPPDVLQHPMPFPDRLDYAEKIVQEAIDEEMSLARQLLIPQPNTLMSDAWEYSKKWEAGELPKEAAIFIRKLCLKIGELKRK